MGAALRVRGGSAGGVPCARYDGDAVGGPLMARRRLAIRRPRGPVEYGAAALVFAAAASLVVRLLVWMGEALMRWWPAVVILALLGLVAGAVRVVSSRREDAARARRLSVLRFSLAELDAMDDRQFEFALRDLLIRDGWSARQVGQQGDQAADVIADHPLYGRLVVQAKHTKVGAKVGSQVMYQVNGTAGPVHRANAAAVVTNGGFTRDARQWGERHAVGWVDRERLCSWAERGVPLHQLLQLPTLARRRLPGARRTRIATPYAQTDSEGRMGNVR
ncbi:restriction endonuclease [Streptomyces hydrogenans]|uniref:restriction endonuclease n=1 Tax=Streptomyces hydrogenans TaxID=1873719 RepID=UPI003F54FA06